MATNPSSLLPTLGICPPTSVAAAGTITTGSTFLRLPVGASKIKAVLQVGTVGSTPTHALSAQQATDAAGTGAKNVAGIVATFGTAAGTWLQIDFDVAQLLDINGGFVFLKFTLTNNSGSASLMAGEFETNSAYN